MTLRNFVWFILLAVLFLWYSHSIGKLIPLAGTTLLIYCVGPTLIGSVCFFVFSGKLQVKLGLTLLIPIIWGISLCCQSDGYLFLLPIGVAVMMIPFFLGFGIAFWLHENISNNPTMDS